MGILYESLGDEITIKVIDCLLQTNEDMSKKQIAKLCQISKATLFNHWKSIEKIGVVKVVRKFGKTKLYKINEESPIVKKLIELKDILSEQQKLLVKPVEIKPAIPEKKQEVKEVQKQPTVAA